MNRPIVVFDVDDILWSLNKRAAKLAGIPYEKIHTYNASDNDQLTDEEKDRLNKVYFSTELFEEMNFYEGIERINNLDAEVHIISHVLQTEAAELKKKNLLKVLSIPEENIHLQLVSLGTNKKELLENTFIFVDDSPYNIVNSTATYNIMLSKPWNTSDKAYEIMKDVSRTYCNTLNQIVDYIEKLLKNYKSQ